MPLTEGRLHGKPLTCQSKRAQELIGVEQQQAALQLLHEHVTSKRTRNSPIASLEPVMILFVELCVDLRKGKLAKDGLYQYKNTAQNTNVGTIEVGYMIIGRLAGMVANKSSSSSNASSNSPSKRLPKPRPRRTRFSLHSRPQRKPRTSTILRRPRLPSQSSCPQSPASSPATGPTAPSLHHG